jgi:hypothetical protein
LRYIHKNDRGISLPALAGWNRYLAARHVAGVLEVFAHSSGYAKKAMSENLILHQKFVPSGYRMICN